MATQIEDLEERLKSSLFQLQVECGVLERMVYKNKNQHRRCSYFRYLLKVRRDLKLLQSINLEELLESCFHVITGRKSKQKVNLLESLKRRKTDAVKYNFMERLLGAARLLSQMVEPMLKTATEISTLLARSFFMGFSLTILALLARVRVLVQQILLDVVSVYNEVSSISQKKQSIKINQDGIEVFREYYPVMEQVTTVECVWETDKFVLVEQTTKRHQDENQVGGAPLGAAVVRYKSVKAFLGVDELDLMEANLDASGEANPTHFKRQKTSTLASPSTEADQMRGVGDTPKPNDGLGTTVPPSQSLDLEKSSSSFAASPSLLSPGSSFLNTKTSTKNKVAFISVKIPAPALAASTAAVVGDED
ncbi:hypothetical protein Dimus_021548 [Dionaea muscipula]